MTKAELIAAADALELFAKDFLIGKHDAASHGYALIRAERLRAQAAQASDEQPVSDYLPPLRDFMYHSVRGTEYTFSSGGPHTVFGYLNDECLDDIWECINTAARTGGYLRPSPRESRLEGLLNDLAVTMKHAYKFITSREKMHPNGVALYEQDVERIRAELEQKT